MRRRKSARTLAPVVRAMVEQLEARRLLAAATGPDRFGYTADPVPVEQIDLAAGQSGVVTIVARTDDASEPFDLAANTFNFYGTPYSGSDAFFISTNGLITFDEPNLTWTNQPLASWPTQRAIAAIWDDWYPRDDAGDEQVLAKIDGNRLIVEWDCKHIRDGASSAVRFHAILELNTGSRPGDITFNYVDIGTDEVVTAEGASSAVGIKDAGLQADNVLQISYSEADVSGDPESESTASPLVGSGKAIRIRNVVTGQPHADAGPDQNPEDAEGAIVLDASKSSDPNQPAASLTYDWDLDADGVFGETGEDAANGDEVGVRPTFRNPAQGGSATLTLRITDSSGQTSFDALTVEVPEPQAVAGIDGPSNLTAGVAANFTVTATNLGSEEGAVFWIVEWGDELNDQPFGDPAGFGLSHTYAEPGTYTIRVSVSNSDEFTKTVTVGPRPDVLLADDGTLIVTGTAGNDTISLQPAAGGNLRLTRNGTVTTYPAADVARVDVELDAGNDRYDAADIDLPLEILAGDGNDTLVTGDGDDIISAGDGDNDVTAGGGLNEVSAAGDGDNVIRLDRGYVFTGQGNDTVIGGDGGVDANASSGNDSITTGSGDDHIDATGAATIASGAGNDTILASGDPVTGAGATIDTGAGDDIIGGQFVAALDCGDGDDRAGISLSSGPIDGGAGNDRLNVWSDDQHPASVIGGDGDDSISTGPGRDVIFCGAGRDTVHAGSGSDLISGGGGRDVLFGQGGNDRLYGGNGDDRLEGQGGNDRLLGGTGADHLFGGDGENTALDDDPLDELTDVGD